MSDDLVKVTGGNARFANKLYEIVNKPNENIFFSPISAHTVLSMAHQGAAGVTSKEFADALHVPDHKIAASGYKDVITSINSIKNVTLHIGNKIFVMKNFPLKSAFQKAITEFFLSEAENVDFGDTEATASAINQWVESKTNSKIKNLISPHDLNDLTRLVLVNAIYFKGNWAHKFSKDATKTEPFYITSDNKVDCQMMHIDKKFRFREYEDLDAKVLEMPYDNENVSMVAILPNAIDGIDNLEKKLRAVDLSKLTQHMSLREVVVSLPKFKIETTIHLNDVLKKMGLNSMFAPGKANFSEISESPEPLYVSKVIQKAFIEVNEEGAEAAAATGMIAVAMCYRPPQQFQANHPFIVILQARTGNINNILFVGRISNPTV